ISVSQNRYRTILPGHPYKLPPSQNKLNPLEIDGKTFIRKLDFNAGKIAKQIVRTLVGISPFIANEIVHQAKLGAIEIYQEKFENMQALIKHNRFTPAIYRNGKEEFHVLPITHLESNPEAFNDTNTMLDAFYSGKAE